MDLFDVFDEEAPALDQETKQPSNVGDKRPRSSTSTDSEVEEIFPEKKDENNKSNNNNDNDTKSFEKAEESKSKNDNDKKKSSKRMKKGLIGPGPKAVVTDSFETEASREVTASSGLLPQEATGEGEKNVVLSHQVRHQVALPPKYDYVPISKHVIKNPAKTYPFTLDPFQQVSITSIDRNESVLVSAHTSAGKTVVAEYAIAQCLRDKQRVIYTSPIKALSNQKYRELLERFHDVGLMTGDVTINPEASCLVMTTEILRSMLYRGSEVIREVAWVIFDEIHYMRDPERGVVWEETIILLPDKVHYVFLSATIPNAMQFAEWVCKTHNQPCHVVYTNFRPTPLQHYLFPKGGNGIFLVVDEKSNFREDNFQKAMGILGNQMGEDPASADAKHKKGKIFKGGKKELDDIYKIVRMVIQKSFNPVIVFSFSKRDCEQHALKLAKLNLNNEDEIAMVDKIFNNAMNSLSEEDRKLPQISHLLPLLRRGIGVHHSGLLPILKEVIEILFQEGYIKVLFATETFSIGLNMPAKTVVFTNVRKYDGVNFRWVSGGEYIQMSGRAGRRGLDDRGIVILMIDEQMEPTVAKGMVTGQADRLDSAFHLSYNMILNLLRVEGISPEFMLERCFFQYQNQDKIPELEKEYFEVKEKISTITIDNEDDIKDYYETREQIEEFGKEIQTVITHPTHIVPYLQPGRLIHVKINGVDFDWGVIVSFDRRKTPKAASVVIEPHKTIVVEVLLWLTKASPVNLLRKKSPILHPGIMPSTDPNDGKMEAIWITLDSIAELGNLKVFLPKELTTAAQRNPLKKNIEEIKRRFPDGIPRPDPVENMKIVDSSFLKTVRKIEVLETRLAQNPLCKSPELEEKYNEYANKVALIKKGKELKNKLSKAYAVMQLDELRNRKNVLKQLEFITPDELVELKGRVACEISTGDELVITEMIFNGSFSTLTPEQCAALLSCFVFDEKTREKPALVPELQIPYNSLLEVARRVGQVSKQCKLEIGDLDEYLGKFKMELMDVVFQWCKGASFAQICRMTDAYEGSLIRLFRRLEELLMEVAEAAKIMGNNEIKEKMEKALGMIKRDMVSASSLYL